ncbi:hypothetical protein J5N97_020621 [Dioscorea zingiberensis]|uniref:Uncharacterized protein n=1 Tax=Dioscorea zingiberensis TaxID=325984 RepID=A0A9D5HDV3_9LILI|nr:hypothetical protein J5N97_020621 [Dioscorea zingiberensis]
MASPASSAKPSSPFQDRSHSPILQPSLNLAALKALKGAGINVILGKHNEDLQALTFNTSFAAAWVTTNVLHNSASIRATRSSLGHSGKNSKEEKAKQQGHSRKDLAKINEESKKVMQNKSTECGGTTPRVSISIGSEMAGGTNHSRGDQEGWKMTTSKKKQERTIARRTRGKRLTFISKLTRVFLVQESVMIRIQCRRWRHRSISPPPFMKARDVDDIGTGMGSDGAHRIAKAALDVKVLEVMSSVDEISRGASEIIVWQVARRGEGGDQGSSEGSVEG